MARIAIPLAEGFEDSEFSVPYARFRKAGHEQVIIGKKAGETVHGKNGADEAKIDKEPLDVNARDFQLLLIPGGNSPDHLRTEAAIIAFVRAFWETGRPVAAICHGPQLLIDADVLRDKELTSWPSIRRDLENAGAHWVDKEVAEDGQLITSRKPADLEPFCAAVERRLEAQHGGAGRTAG